MTLQRSDFGRFFSIVSGDVSARPFPWQERLLDYVIEHGRWPEQINAPTGSGKSVVVDVHVFATALAALDLAPRLPRRLVVVVNRRALVDAQFRRAQRIQELLRERAYDATEAVADALALLSPQRTWAVTPPDFQLAENTDEVLRVTNLRGGLAPVRGWIDDPETCQVIAATPDMWGSRLLMRGYGSSQQARPREAGLFAYDCVAVVDEAHLTRQLLATAQRIAALEDFAINSIGLPRLQVVETTATPTVAANATVGVREEDLADCRNTALTHRLTRPKPVEYVASAAWPSRKATRPHIDTLVSAIEKLCDEVSPDNHGVIGCVVNRVDTALQVAAALKGKRNVAVWVGRMRAGDAQELQENHPEVFAGSQPGKHRLDVLVATQTVEVGIDLDFAHLVTELASAPALAQRAGRVNRIGSRETGRVVVVGPRAEPTEDFLPYRQEDLLAAYKWLETFVNSDDGLAPWKVRSTPPPIESPRRILWQRLEMYDAWRLARTSERTFTQEDLTLFLHDDLDSDTVEAGVVFRPIPETFGRGRAPLDLNLAVGLLEATPPTPNEVFPGDLRLVRTIADQIRDKVPTACLYRDGELTALGRQKLRPGDVLVLPDTEHWTTFGVLVEDPGKAEQLQVGWGEGRTAVFGDDPLCSQLAGLSAEEAQNEYESIHSGEIPAKQVLLPPGAEDLDRLPWIVLTDSQNELDPETLQETVLRGEVSLAQHQANVAQRAGEIATRLGLPPALVEILKVAGLLHDEGKRDFRFQRRLSGERHMEPLAKSSHRNAQEARRAMRASGLRSGWRHEQLSAAIASTCGHETADRDLVTRLVGTSHGRGREEFDPPVAEYMTKGLDESVSGALTLLYGSDAAWHDVVEGTERRWGIWGCAYLEAILRAADCRISSEGS